MTSASVSGVAQELSGAMAGFLSLLLMLSSLHKVTRHVRASKAVEQLGGVSPAHAALVLAMVSCLEFVAALLLCAPQLRDWGAMLAGGIFAVYAFLLWRAVAQGRLDVDCSCNFGVSTKPLGLIHVLRPALLSCIAMATGAVSVLCGAETFNVTQLMSAIAGLAFYAAIDELGNLAPVRTGHSP